MDIPTIFKQVQSDCVLLWEKRSSLWKQHNSSKDKKIAFAATRVFLALALAFACLATLRLLFRAITIASCVIAPAISILIFGIKHDIFVIFKNESKPTHQKVAAVGIAVVKDGKDRIGNQWNNFWSGKKTTKTAPRHHLSEGTFAPFIWNYIFQSNPNYWKSVFNSLVDINEK